MHRPAAAFVFALFALLAPPSHASTKSAQAGLKGIQNASFKQFRSDAAAVLDIAFAQVSAVELQVKNSSVTPKNAVEDAVDALGPALADVSALAFHVMVDVAIAGEPLLATEPGETVPGFLVGDGSVTDAFEAKVDKELSKLHAKVMKRIRAFAKVLSKATAGDYHLAAVMPVQHVNGGARMNKVANASPSDVIFWPQRILLALGGSAASIANDGRLVFALQARLFVTSGDGKANVYITGPSPLTVSLNILTGTVNESGYGQTKFDNLKAGAYTALFDQDGSHDNVVGEDAYEKAIVGVP